jgi:hypothetical protein
MSEHGVRGTSIIIGAAIVAALGLFLVVVGLAEHQRESRLLIETILFLPLLLSSLTVVRLRRS